MIPRDEADKIFRGVKSNLNYWSNTKNLYLPDSKERKVDKIYILGLFRDEYFTV